MSESNENGLLFFGFTIRFGCLINASIYYYGVFSGYYMRHGPYTNDNPNVFILPGVGWLGGLVIIEQIFNWHRRRQIKRNLELAKGLAPTMGK